MEDRMKSLSFRIQKIVLGAAAAGIFLCCSVMSAHAGYRDLWMSDISPAAWPDQPCSSNYVYYSPDISVQTSQYTNHCSQPYDPITKSCFPTSSKNPEHGQTNYVYVKVRYQDC